MGLVYGNGFHFQKVQRKRYWPASEGRHVRLALSAKAIKTVDTIGIEAAVARIRARGVKV
ncbi:hypothetical protein ACFWNG_04220 [Streptomyces sp. NPDC058391]|uniref:hypothetical protein n=1 Tax=Streptomyces sp. NPDC058391 TaxID=3346476 RepID=UPI003648534E